MKRKFVVWDLTKGFAVHEGTEESCHQYIDTCVTLWGHKRSRYEVR